MHALGARHELDDSQAEPYVSWKSRIVNGRMGRVNARIVTVGRGVIVSKSYDSALPSVVATRTRIAGNGCVVARLFRSQRD